MPSSDRSAAALYQAGLAAYERGDYQQAADLLGPLQDQSNLPATLARYYLGQSHLQLGIAALRGSKHRTAAAHFETARRLNPGSAELPKYLAACHAVQQRFDLASAELERGAGRADADASLPVRLAHAFVKDAMPERAVETLSEAIRRFPFRAEYRKQLGIILASADRHADAVVELQAGARLAPLDATVRQYLGLSLAACGDIVAAVEHLAVARKLRPGDAHLAWLLALACDAAQMSAPSVASCTESVVSHENGPALDELAALLTREPDFVEAFLSLPPAQVDAEVFGMLASVLERALEHCPDYADLHHHCSRVYERLGRTEAAIAEAERATTINPRYVQALIQLGRLYARTQRGTDAIERLEEAIASGGDYPDVHYLIGELYRQRGQKSAARRQYRRALELNANYRQAREALALVA